jgi:hypothetical protein
VRKRDFIRILRKLSVDFPTAAKRSGGIWRGVAKDFADDSCIQSTKRVPTPDPSATMTSLGKLLNSAGHRKAGGTSSKPKLIRGR